MERGQDDDARFLFKSVVTEVKRGGLGRQKLIIKPSETIKTIKMASTLYKIGEKIVPLVLPVCIWVT